MTDYFVDDGGNGSDGLSWATAYTSLAALVAAVSNALTTNGNRIYIGADHVDQNTYSANHTFTGPSSGLPVILISSTVGSGTTVSYAASTTRQIDTTNNNANTYTLNFDGSFAFYGLSCKAHSVGLSGDDNESIYAASLRLAIGANQAISLSATSIDITGLTIDLTADGTTTRTDTIILPNASNRGRIQNLSLVNGGYRTGSVLRYNAGNLELTGADLSALRSDCEILSYSGSEGLVASNILTAATWAPAAVSSGYSYARASFANCGPADAPTYLYEKNYFGTALSSPSIYRTGGATVEGDACSWLVATAAVCGEGAPFYTPWIYGTVASTGSTTFDAYITNDTADFTDAECWLEVEYLSTADEAICALATDQRSTITATAAAQTDDTTSTWNGTGPSFTYKQKLSVTATVGETGQFRARVAVGVASIASSRYFYVDPAVFVGGVLATSSNLLIPGAGIVGQPATSSAHARFGDRTGGLR